MPPRMAGKCSNHPLLASLVGSLLVCVNTGCNCGSDRFSECRCRNSVSPLQARISTPITVVSCMIRNAFSLLSCTPIRLARQK